MKPKRLLSLLLVLALTLTLSACGDDDVALYVDDKLVGVLENAADIQAVLDEVQALALAEHSGVGELRATFVQDVRLQEQSRFHTKMMDKETLKKLLTAKTEVAATYVVQKGDTFAAITKKHNLTEKELQELNPDCEINKLEVGTILNVGGTRMQSFLQVQVVQTLYEEGVKIPYKTRTVYRNDKYTDYENVITEGKDGVKNVTTAITYVDGYEVERTVIDEVITQEPITKEVEVGAKIIKPEGWVWPVPICHRVYVGYSSGHRGIAISSGPVPVLGTPAVAANGGEVIFASTGWNDGYGTMVKIQHDNGIVTVYAHLQSLSVEVGQKVTAGQEIGLIGNTGNSNGPHLYFEVIRNGIRVNPLNYVTP